MPLDRPSADETFMHAWPIGYETSETQKVVSVRAMHFGSSAACLLPRQHLLDGHCTDPHGNLAQAGPWDRRRGAEDLHSSTA